MHRPAGRRGRRGWQQQPTVTPGIQNAEVQEQYSIDIPPWLPYNI
ncbi:hypothetical protein CLOSTHATH_01958 [Hungatella hathewayi DSM 13479]|uniref:Uncharacterized protein n=1 Tax=Hungatella hathewayi DSM 13479 TaxID=566550 RepID=D3AEC7_9FIRM|nr:hypothetical protein CLOSTHATH_01958 [Hungatella hathewayi DSM 13479]